MPLVGAAAQRRRSTRRRTRASSRAICTRSDGNDADKTALHEALAALSTDSDHRVVEDTDHMGMIADQNGAAATTRAILDVLSSVRAAGPLVR